MLIMYTHLARGRIHNYRWDAICSATRKRTSVQETKEAILQWVKSNPFKLTLAPPQSMGEKEPKVTPAPEHNPEVKRKADE